VRRVPQWRIKIELASASNCVIESSRRTLDRDGAHPVAWPPRTLPRNAQTRDFECLKADVQDTAASARVRPRYPNAADSAVTQPSTSGQGAYASAAQVGSPLTTALPLLQAALAVMNNAVNVKLVLS